MNQARMVRLPIHIQKDINSCFKVIKEFASEKSYFPTQEEIAKEMDKSTEEISEMFVLFEGQQSADSSIVEPEYAFIETLPDESAEDPVIKVEQQKLKDYLTFWLKQLSPKHKDVVVRRFGLLGYEQLTLEEVGLALGITRERVRQIQTEALKRLRKLLEKDGYRMEKNISH